MPMQNSYLTVSTYAPMALNSKFKYKNINIINLSQISSHAIF